jgi:nitric oxide reductase subunit B
MVDATVRDVAPEEEDTGSLSPWWGRALAVTMVFGFAVLILLTAKAYENAPPIPQRAVAPDGAVVFTAEDVADGQAVFLRYGLMNNGSIWGHGAYLGPDFTAQYLHNVALAAANRIAQERFGKPFDALAPEDRAAAEGAVAARLKENRLDPTTGTLRLLPADAETFEREVAYWTEYFKVPDRNGGLTANAITDPGEIRALTSFFAWTAWAAVAQRPGTAHSYTNNFPYDPLAGNEPTGATVFWSAISLIFLLAGIAVVLLAFGKFEYLGWHGAAVVRTPRLLAPSAAQVATLKFMGVAALLFLGQTLIGGGLAHYRADPGSFYGIDLAAFLPSNLLRTWHLQLAILWIATAYVGGALFVASMLARRDPPGHERGINLLFVALAIVVVGSLLGEWAGILQWLGDLWFWIGNQGWEYLELGRAWQFLLAIGLVFWFWLLWRTLAPARQDPQRRSLANFFLIAAAAVPIFYLPALFFGAKSNYTVVDTWRFWIVHLWVEGFFEFFVTVIVAAIFFELRLVQRLTALRIIYLDAILYFSGGLIGTGHHWYFTGHTELNMAFAACYSALEVVPLTLLTLDAWDFVRITREEGASELRHKWTFYFLMAVGFWNFVGAGIFGFLINLPIVSYFEVGTIFTTNHGHAAMMGVFGMLAVGLMCFVLRQSVREERWPMLEKYVKCAFIGLNAGLLLMVVLSLFPGGFMQIRDVLEHGYWHARSLAYSGTETARLIEWLRFPGDIVFIVFGALPMVIALGIGYADSWRHPRRAAPGTPEPAE